MRWLIERDVMVDALQNLISIIEKATIMPITSNVKLHVHNDKVLIVATDTKLQIKSEISLASDQQITEPFSTTVSAQKLLDSCRVAKDKEIVFNLEKDKLNISFQDGNFSLLTLPADEFPEIQDPDTISTVSLSQRTWFDLINSTVFAVAEQNHREAIRGLLLEVEGSIVRCVGTDGHRLSVAETQANEALEGDLKRAIIPKKSVQEMQRLFDQKDNLLSLSFSGDNHVSFKLEHNNITFTSNLIEADYPNYSAVVPKDNPCTLSVSRKDFSVGIANAVIIQSDLPKTVYLKLETDKITVSSRTLEGETSEMVVDASFDGKSGLEMGFNEMYLQGSIKSMLSDQLEIKVGESNKSVLISEVGEVSRYNVVMPLNT